jgi:hypothetical protein
MRIIVISESVTAIGFVNVGGFTPDKAISRMSSFEGLSWRRMHSSMDECL